MRAELTIGRIARGAGVNIQTVRYYERRGLLSPEAYRDSGYRLYSREAVRKLQFIKNAQKLGFTLEEIAGLLRLRVGRRSRCEDVRRKAEAKLKQVNEKLAGLKSMRRVLERLVRTCRDRKTTAACPILESLEHGGQHHEQ